jgi:hypothetical protein
MRLVTFTRRQFVKLLSAVGFYRFLGINKATAAISGSLSSDVYIPSFYEDIKPLFTHYDRIKMMYLLDVWDYEQVKALSTRILASLQQDPNRPGWSLLPGVRLMPLYTGPWPSSQVDLFKAWIDGGCKGGTALPTPPPSSELPTFVSLSEALTGFDALDENATLAQSYLDLIRSSCAKSDVDGIFAVWKEIGGLEQSVRDSRIERDIMNSDTLGQLARWLILLWYTGSLYRADGSVQQTKEGYIEGLVWKAIKAHPIGYANETVDFYWKDRPTGINYTGLDVTSSRRLSGADKNADL